MGPKLFHLAKISLRRSFSNEPFRTSYTSVNKSKLINLYNKYKSMCSDYEPVELINPKGVFANNEIDLKEIQVYGFDYDYTLAYYNVSLYQLIFNLARDSLIENQKYPNDLKHLEYLPHFPIRGLHLDKRKGWLMKIDSYHNIQMSTVYHGMNPVDRQDVLNFFHGTRLNIDDIGHMQTSSTFHHFVDLFCLPEISLISGIYQYFLDKGIHFSPEYVFQDVRDAVNSIHRSQILHKQIVQSIDDYLLPIKEHNNNNFNQINSSSIYIKEFLTRLNKSGKKVFLITNSPYWFVNFGMQSLCGSDWTNLFDLIICNARKPDFFTSKSKQFRKFNLQKNSKSWERVTRFKKGEVYYEGNLFEMMEQTGWKRHEVLYFGDHIYGDLAEPFLKHGWRTGAILNEVEYEVTVTNRKDFQRSILWLNTLEKLIEMAMFLEPSSNDEEEDGLNNAMSSLSALELRKLWLNEREEVKRASKKAFNPYFGSVFRSYNNPSFFSRRLSRFADIYTSNVTNLLNYPIDYQFIPRRIDLAHEMPNRVDLELEFN